MNPNDLVARSAPQSIDLVAAARTQTKAYMQPRVTKEYERAGLRCVKLIDPSDPEERRPQRAYGRSTQTFSDAQWTVAELGQAAKDVPEIAFMAACYSFAGEMQLFHRLKDALFAESLRLRRRLNWPMQVQGSDGRQRSYLPELVDLVLHEEARPSLFKAAPRLFADYLGVTQELWGARIEECYAHVKQAYHLWLSDAYRIMAPRLRDDVIEDDRE